MFACSRANFGPTLGQVSISFCFCFGKNPERRKGEGNKTDDIEQRCSEVFNKTYQVRGRGKRKKDIAPSEVFFLPTLADSSARALELFGGRAVRKRCRATLAQPQGIQLELPFFESVPDATADDRPLSDVFPEAYE
jgi:hypothetical protein